MDPKVTGKPSDAATAGKPGIGPAVGKPGPVKSEPTKTEPAKPGPTGSSALSGSTAPGASSRPQDAKADTPLKPGATGSSAMSPSASPSPASGPTPGAPGQSSPGPDASSTASAAAPGGSAPLKPAATGSSAVPPGPVDAKDAGTKDTARPEAPVKPGATGSSAVKPETPPPGSKPDVKPAASPGATRVTEAAALTEGPILDLKAKRLSDPADAAKAGARPEAGKDGPAATGSAKGSSKEAKEPAKAAPARGGAGFGAVAASGLLGGLIGAGLLYGVTTYQRGADPRIATLDKAVAGLATKDAVAALDKRLAADEQALKPLPEAVGRAEAAAKAANERAGEALQKASAAPAAEGAASGSAGGSTPAVPADIAARLDALDQRVSALQEEPGRDGGAEMKAIPAVDPAVLTALDERVKALEANGAKAPDLSDKLAALQGDVESRTKANEAADAALTKRVDAIQTTLEGRIAAATQAVQEATQASKQAAEAAQGRADETARGLEHKLQEQGERIASLDKAVDQSAKQATVQSALRIVAADRITSALEAGQPYPEALASLRNLEPADSKRLDALAPFADKGAPTAASLAAQFRTIADKIAEAKRAAEAKSVAETGSVGDRLMNMASSLVQVKRVEAPAQAGAPTTAGGTASTAQVQAALDRGDLTGAAKAYAALPEEARAQGGDFGERLTARAEAARAAQSLVTDAFTGLPPAR